MVEALCNKHNTLFTQGVIRHLNGKTGCPNCSKDKKLNTHSKTRLQTKSERKENFLNNVSAYQDIGEYYTYPNIDDEFENNESIITIVCKKHLDTPFQMPVQQHKFGKRGRGHGCPCCKSEAARLRNRTSFETVKEKFSEHGLTILSNESEYINNKSRLQAHCNNCGYNDYEGLKVANVFRTDTVLKCRNCIKFSRFGISEEFTRRLVSEYFDAEFPKYHITEHPSYKFLELDGYSKEIGIAFEYQGIYHEQDIFGTESLINQQERDREKVKFCTEVGISLLVIERFKFKRALPIISSIKKNLSDAFFNIGMDFDEDFITNGRVQRLYKDVGRSPVLLKQLDEFCEQHNLELLSERVYLGVDYKHQFKCKLCQIKLPILYGMDQLRRNGVPCPCNKKPPKKRVIDERSKQKSLNALKERVKGRGVKLTSAQWIGSKPRTKYDGICQHCKLAITFTYNTACNEKKPLCKCQFKPKQSKRTSSDAQIAEIRIAEKVKVDSDGLFELVLGTFRYVREPMVIKVVGNKFHTGFQYIIVNSHSNYIIRNTYKNMAEDIRKGRTLNSRLVTTQSLEDALNLLNR